MAKKLFKDMALEDFLLPWEADKDGKKLETPGEINVEQLRKYMLGLLTDKEAAQERAAEADTTATAAKKALEDLQKKNETDEQRRAREDKEREEHYEKLEKAAMERDKLDAIEKAFEDQGITPARAKRLAKRVRSEDPDEWVDEAKELVEDGFRISDAKPKEGEEVEEQQQDETLEDTFTSRPVSVRRSNGRPAEAVVKAKPKSVAEELDAAGIGMTTW